MMSSDNQPEQLLLPNLVPVEHELILSPEAKRQRELDLIAEMEAERANIDWDDDEEPELSERVRHGVCVACGHRKLLFLPARLCERDLRKAAENAGIPFPEQGGRMPLNREERRREERRQRRQRR